MVLSCAKNAALSYQPLLADLAESSSDFETPAASHMRAPMFHGPEGSLKVTLNPKPYIPIVFKP